jgi:hypothetical protein
MIDKANVLRELEYHNVLFIDIEVQIAVDHVQQLL